MPITTSTLVPRGQRGAASASTKTDGGRSRSSALMPVSRPMRARQLVHLKTVGQVLETAGGGGGPAFAADRHQFLHQQFGVERLGAVALLQCRRQCAGAIEHGHRDLQPVEVLQQRLQPHRRGRRPRGRRRARRSGPAAPAPGRCCRNAAAPAAASAPASARPVRGRCRSAGTAPPARRRGPGWRPPRRCSGARDCGPASSSRSASASRMASSRSGSWSRCPCCNACCSARNCRVGSSKPWRAITPGWPLPLAMRRASATSLSASSPCCVACR